MARRSKTSPFEDFVSLVALLPWWACLGVGLMAYFVLHRIAQPAVLTGIQPNQLGEVVTRSMFLGLAMAGQFVLPLACVIAAAISAARRHRRGSLVAGVAQSRAPDALESMSWRDFERLVGEALANKRPSATTTRPAAGDNHPTTTTTIHPSCHEAATRPKSAVQVHEQEDFDLVARQSCSELEQMGHAEHAGRQRHPQRRHQSATTTIEQELPP